MPDLTRARYVAIARDSDGFAMIIHAGAPGEDRDTVKRAALQIIRDARGKDGGAERHAGEWQALQKSLVVWPRSTVQRTYYRLWRAYLGPPVSARP